MPAILRWTGSNQRQPATSIEESAVQKGLCIAAFAIALIVFAIFLADLILGAMKQQAIAPFHGANLTIDIVFVVCSLILGLLSWFTLKEQV